MPIYGKGNIQKYTDLNLADVNAKYDGGWHEMLDKKPKIRGHTFEAQAEGTWLDVTTQEELDTLADDAVNGPIVAQKYEAVMAILEGLPIDPAISFMILYVELNEYAQHGTQGPLLLNLIQTSGRTPQQVLGYLEPLMEDLSIAMGKMIGRRINT